MFLQYNYIKLKIIEFSMAGKPKESSAPKEISLYGGLEDLTDEQIEKNIRDYPYVMGKLKEC